MANDHSPSSSASSQTARQWLILSMIPKTPPRIDAAGLERRLRERGIEVHRRTIQRDLIELSRIFPLVADARAKPFGWRWADDAEFLCSIPVLRHAEPATEHIELVLRAEASMARAIAEGLRGRDGDAREVKVTRGATPEAHVTLAATVPDRCALRRWLLGFGAAIEVLGPEPLRAEFRAKARDLAERYGEHAGCTGSRA